MSGYVKEIEFNHELDTTLTGWLLRLAMDRLAIICNNNKAVTV